ncbi:MAG: cytochrome c-type biogenesis protein [Pseudomonadota bacterium]|nr:cytochrome c-type biogenesis protein [Pseudomonadota bacterium]
MIVRLATLLLLIVSPSSAMEPDEILADRSLETRARIISKELRCVVCQNQSIDDSDAPLARDLRMLVRNRLKLGDTNEEAIDFVAKRYGDFVLLRPPFQASTLLLWVGPALILILGFFIITRWYRRQAKLRTFGVRSLSPDQRTRVDSLLSKHDDQ